jgi:hypothetical protein
MIPKSPVIDGREEDEVQLGKRQPQFQTLPTIFFRDPEGRKALNRWELEEDEFEELARTRTLFISQICGDGSPRPIQPSVFPPVIPDPAPDAEAPAADEGATPLANARPVMFEFRLVPLDRQSGNPKGSVETAARVYVDLTTLALNFTAVGGETKDPTEIIDRQLDTFARVLANSYGADCYFRLFSGEPGGWKVIEGTLADGAHVNRTVRATAAFVSTEVTAAFLDLEGDGVTVGIAVAMMKELRNRFEAPFRLLGFSRVESPDAVSVCGDRISTIPLDTLPDLVKCFRELRPEGEFCVLVAGGDGQSEKSGVFLLDLRLFEKARSN